MSLVESDRKIELGNYTTKSFRFQQGTGDQQQREYT